MRGALCCIIIGTPLCVMLGVLLDDFRMRTRIHVLAEGGFTDHLAAPVGVFAVSVEGAVHATIAVDVHCKDAPNITSFEPAIDVRCQILIDGKECIQPEVSLSVEEGWSAHDGSGGAHGCGYGPRMQGVGCQEIFSLQDIVHHASMDVIFKLGHP